jgi:uncharacterized protein with ParB-like and HNH nuclease domain
MSNSRFDARALTVDQLLAPHSAAFQIPPFQRRYAWGKQEIVELFDDLFEQYCEQKSGG